MITTVEKALRTVLQTVANEYDPDDLPGLVHFSPGAEVAWDNCCEGGGQLYLRVITLHPTGPFPVPQLATGCRADMFNAHIAVGVVRCAHTVDDSGHSPTETQMNDDFSLLMGDLTMVLQGLQEASTSLLKVVLGRWTPRGPSGGCMAGEWDAHVALSCVGWVDD